MGDLRPTRTRRHRKRPEHARCPRCGKLRTMWLRANEWSWGRKIACLNVPGEGKVCWICRIREVAPDWRPGMPLPEVPNETKCGNREVSVKDHEG